MLRSIATTMVLCGTLTQAGIAQDRREAPRDVKVYKLKHLSAQDALDIVRQVIDADFSVDNGHSVLIVRGRDEEHQQVQTLLKEIDVPRDSGAATPGELYRLSHRHATEVAKVLGRAFPQRLQVTPDEATGTLLLNGTGETLSAARQMLDSLDDPQAIRSGGRSPGLTITIDVILGTLGSTEANTLPPHLGSVGEALVQQGLGGCAHLGHIMARLNEQEQFSARGVMPVSGTTSEVQVTGAGILHEDGRTAEVMFDANLVFPVTHRNKQTGESTERYSDFGIETTTTVPLGDYLVLGAIPTSLGDANTVVMVIRVTR